MSTYAFDQTGLLPENKIINELKSITVMNGVDGYLIIPNKAPYFLETLDIVDEAGNYLEKGTEYLPTHRWDYASTYLGKEIYGTVLILPNVVNGSFKLSYQTLGGDFADNHPSDISEGLVVVSSLNGVVWTDQPVVFPVEPHNHALSDFEGIAAIVQKLDEVKTALLESPAGITMDEIEDIDTAFINPLLAKLTDIKTAILTRAPTVVDYDDRLTNIEAVLNDIVMGGIRPSATIERIIAINSLM